MNSDVGGTLRYIITADTDDFERTLRKAGKDFESFADQINQASGGVGKGLKDSVTEGSTEGTRAFRKFVDDSISALGEFTSALAKVSFNSFTTAAGAASTAMSAMVGKGMNIGSSLEKNRLSFEALTGSVKGAETVLTSVADFASENPYQLLDVSNVARELVAMGRSADQVAPDLAKLGAIGVATGADLGSLGHVYGQIAAQGKMMTQDMYQLVNQGVAIMPALSKVTGKSMTELKDYISKGQVTMEVFEQALTQVVDPAMYENLLNKMNNTIPRQMDRLKGSISTFATSLVGIDKWTGQKLETGLAQTYTNILKKLADNLRDPKLIASVQKLGQAIAKMVDKFVPLIDKIAPALTKVFDKLADNTSALLPIVGGALVMFGRLGSNLPGIGGIIGNLSGSISTLGKSFLKLFKVNPLLGAFVTMLTVALPKALSNASVRKSLSSIMTSIKKIGEALAPVIAKIAELASTIGTAVLVPAINALAKVLEVFANVLSAIPTPMLTSLITALIGFMAVKKVSTPLKVFGGAIRDTFGYIKEAGKFAKPGGIIATFKDALGIGKGAEKATKEIKTTLESVKSIGTTAQTAGQSLTKGQQFMKTMRSGIMNMILLAGAIAALGLAMRIAYEALNVDMGALAMRLGAIAVVVTAMGALAMLAEKVKISKSSIINLTLLAAPIVTFALAMRMANEAIPDDLGSLSAKLGILGGTILAMGLLAGIAGQFKQQIFIGLLLIVGMAGTLALTAVAIRAAYDVMPESGLFGELMARIGSLMLVIVEIGVLAGVLGALMMTGVVAVALAIGLPTMIAIAGSLTLTALALRAAYDAMPDDFEGFQKKIGSLAAVVTEIGGLSIALGAMQVFSFGLLSAGLFTLMEISVALAVSAKGISSAANDMPSDMNAAKDKIKAGIDFLVEMREQYGSEGGLIGAIKNFFWNEQEGTQKFDTFVRISQRLALVARNLATTVGNMPSGAELDAVLPKIEDAVEFLNKLREEYGSEGGLIGTLKNWMYNESDGLQHFDTINKIAESLDTLATNLENLANHSVGKLSRVVNGNLFSTLKSAIDKIEEQFTSEGGIFVSIGSFFSNHDNTSTLDNATKISETLTKFVDNLAKIQDVNISKLNTAINTTIPKLKEAVTKLKDEFSEQGGGIGQAIANFFSGGTSTETLDKAKDIAEKLGGMTSNIGAIADLDVSKLNKLASDDEATNPISRLKGVVTKLKSTFVDDADSVTNKLKDYDTGGLERAKTVAENIKQISDTLSGVADTNLNVPGIETFISNMKTVVSKIVEQFGGDSDLVNFDQETATAIQNVSTVVENLNNMSNNLKNLQEIDPQEVGGKIDKLKEVIKKLKAVFAGEGDVQALDLSAFNDDIISSQVSQIKSIIDSLKQIAEAVQSLPAIPEDVASEGGKIDKITSVIKHIRDKLDNAGEDALDLSGILDLDLSNIPKIVTDLKTIATNITDFPDAATGAENLKTFVGKLSETLNTLGQSFNDAGVYQNMKVVGSTLLDNIVTGFKEKFTSIPDTITEFYNNIKTAFDNNKTNFEGNGKDVAGWITDGLKNGLNEQKDSVWTTFRGVIDNATNGDMRWVATEAAKGIGGAMAQGVAAGISAEIWRINWAVGQLSGAAINKLKSLLGIASPSKVFYELGEYTGEGLAKGLESQVKGVQEAAEDIAEAIRSPFEDLDSLSIGVSGGANGGSGMTKYLTVNQNNNINNGMDYRTMMADLKWELFTA